MPVRDGGGYLADAVASILHQSFSDLELLLVDDHSSDQAIATLPVNDPRLVLLKNTGRGISSACNTGFAHARGEFIARMDADDISLPARIETQFNYLQAHPAVEVCGACVSIFAQQELAGGNQRYQSWLNSCRSPEEIRRELFIEAEPATVFAFFTDPDKMTRWMAVQCEVDAQPGGLFLANVNGTHVARGTFEEVTPNSRIVFTFGWENGAMDLLPGATRIEVDLAAKDRGTLLTFVHSGLPQPAVGPHTDGWTHYLGRLAIAAAGGDPGPDPRAKAA